MPILLQCSATGSSRSVSVRMGSQASPLLHWRRFVHISHGASAPLCDNRTADPPLQGPQQLQSGRVGPAVVSSLQHTPTRQPAATPAHFSAQRQAGRLPIEPCSGYLSGCFPVFIPQSRGISTDTASSERGCVPVSVCRDEPLHFVPLKTTCFQCRVKAGASSAPIATCS